MKRILLMLTVVTALVGAGWVVNDRATFDRAQWLADYEQLKSATEQSYANLRWSRTSKQVDLVALNANTLRALEQATSNSAARRALANFVSGFQDGHFRVETTPPKPLAVVLKLFERESETGQLSFAAAPAEACGSLGFGRKQHELSVAGATPLDGNTFASGLLTTPGGRQFGVIRIPLFQQREYGATCETAWDSFRKGRTGPCDETCQEQFEVYAKQEIAQALADDANGLVKRGAEAVIIDLTGNGGGTEWAEYAAAALSAKPLRPNSTAFVRGQHWLKHFDEDLRTATGTARAELLAMRDSASRVCELSTIWTDTQAQPSCWNDVTLSPNVHPAEQHSYARPYGGRLLIMTDQHTASASEQFAAILVDNGMAKTIGERTMGVGCGYTNGGHPTTLKNSGLVIRMPDCVRLRADGGNEFEGVRPDYPVQWSGDARTKTSALLNVLEELPAR
jgi:hypothetical protein